MNAKTYEEIDALVDTDPLALRDYAWEITREYIKYRGEYRRLWEKNRARNSGY